MQNPIQKSRQSSIVYEKPSVLSEKNKNLTSSHYRRVQILFAGILQAFPTHQYLQKCVREFFYFV